MKKQLKSKKPKLVEGMAKCLYNDGMERNIKVGQVVYVREIPNMRDHCVILRNGKSPLVGYHLDRFELIEDWDD